jgi:aspartate aminotransferase
MEVRELHNQYNLLNPSVKGLMESATLAINEKVKQKRKSGEKVYNLGLGQSPFPVPETVVKALRLYAPEKDYLSVKGLSALCEAVADFHRRNDRVDVRPDCVMIGPGSNELLFLLQLVFHGEIFMPSPCWVSYIPQSKIIGRKASLVHTTFEDKWRITPEKLLQVCRNRIDKKQPALLILNYPGNPEGVTYTKQELKKIAEVSRQNNIIILSDEIYGQLHHEGKHISIARFYPEGTIISSGLSKWCGAGGWRLGTFSFPESLTWLRDAMAVVASETYTSVSAPIQYAAINAFTGSKLIEEYLRHSRRILALLGQTTANMLIKAKLKVHMPEGGFYHFVDFEPYRKKLKAAGIYTSTELCERMLEEKGIACLPGSAFARHDDELTVRIAYVDFDGSQSITESEAYPLSKSLPDDFAEKNCSNVINGIREIGNWLKELK